MSEQRGELYEFGDFRLNVGERVLERLDGAESGHLPEKAFRTLCFMVRNSGRLLTKKEILDEVWPDSFVEENNLDKCVYAIRQFLGENSRGQKYIETVHKHGYRFVTDVTRSEAGEEANALDEVVSIADVPARDDGAHVTDTRESFGEIELSQPVHRRTSLQLMIPIVFFSITAVAVWFAMSSVRPAADPDLSSASAVTETPLAQNSVAGGHSDSRAYDLYVRGKVKVASENREDTEAAIKLLEEAVAIDPNFAEAFAQLARAYNTLAFKFSSDSERKGLHENAEVAIEKALALNPNLAEGHFARGLILWTNTKRFPHEQAIQSYKRSLELDSTSDETHHQLSIVFAHIGLLDEAQHSLNNALQINPNNTMARYRVGVYHAWQGKSDEAIAVFKTIPTDVSPMLTDRSMAEVLSQTGRRSEAETLVYDSLQRYPKDEGGSFTSVKALLLAQAGKRKEAEETILKALEIGKGFGHFHHTTYNAASTYAVLDEPEEAVRWLEITAESGFPNYTYFLNDPNLNNIRDHQRFHDFMARQKLQWERFKSLVRN